MQNYVFAELPEIKNTKQKNQGSKYFLMIIFSRVTFI